MIKKPLLLAAAIALAIGVSGAFTASADARDQIRIVGSSTVFPFSTAVAEEFGRTSDFKTPVVESLGSGGGLKEFCKGVGVEYPDITNASRRIKSSEVETCAKSGVTKITEVKIGFDGIVLANSKSAGRMNLTLQHIWLALARNVPEGGMAGGKLTPNPFKKWSEIDPSLPDQPIEVLGPPPTSGTYDAFVELAMEGGCKTFDEIKAMKSSDKDAYKAACHSIREDLGYKMQGEQDNVIVDKIIQNTEALGIFGYSFLDQNRDRIQGSLINGVEPNFDSIADGSYPISRSMYFYVKNAHVGVIPGIEEYIAAFTDDEAWGPFGFLADKGLIPLPDDVRDQMRADAMALKELEL